MVMSKPTRDHAEIRAWAEKHGIVPVEESPERIDHIPGTLALVHASEVESREKDARISWEDFFAKFDLMGLACVYDTESTGFNEIMQVQGKSAYLHHNLPVGEAAN